VTRAYLLPLSLPGSSIQAVGVFGISPRLPFDSKYQTFFQLVGNRISTLLQSEVHELEREQSAERFSRLMKATPFGVVIGDLHGGLTYVNPALLQTLGYSESEVNSGQVQWRSLTPPEFALADAYAIQQLREFGRCDVYEKAYLARDGRRVPILVGAAVISGSASEPEVGAFVTDLTRLKVAEAALRKANDELEKKVTERTASLKAEILDRKQAEASLRELTGRLLTAQDEERRHMARELHDHAGQTLTALGINLATLQNIARDGNQQIVNLAAQSQQLSDALSKEIRTLSYLLHPPLLDEVGLGSALSWYVDGFSQRSQSKVDLHVAEDLGRLPRELELVIFRVVQECLTNVHRHSGSSEANISIQRLPDAVEFQISDRGKGIAPQKQRELATASAGVGVRGMFERIRQFGGTLEIHSSNEGTRVKGRLPLPVDASEIAF
jgi:PAS domain S-box-containing protein